MPRRLVLLTLSLLASLIVADEPIVEKFESGKVRAKYATKAGEKHGPYAIHFESGKISERGEYKLGKLTGTQSIFSVNGKTLSTANFTEGELSGTVSDYSTNGTKLASSTYKDGKLTNVRVFTGTRMVMEQDVKEAEMFPRRLSEIQSQLETINAPSAKKLIGEDADREAALRRLRSYRAVVGVPHEVELDDTYNKHTKTGAELLQAHGKLSHTPPNPGWPEEKYKFGFKGTSSSNIYNGSGSLAASVDAYMDDSDPGNIDRVGHRRWCLNPFMLKTGFGKSPNGGFSAMWSFDGGRKEVPDWDFVAYPPPGFAASNYFSNHHAWSVTPNPKKYAKLDPDIVKATVYRKTDKSPDKPGEKLELGYNKAETGGFGAGPALIFRPKNFTIENGACYRVVIEGLKTKAGTDTKLEYTVVFVNLN